LGICRKNRWSCDTPNIAGKLETLFKPYGFTKRTTRDYVNAVVDILESEKKYGIDALNYVRLEEHQKRAVQKEPKGSRRGADENPVIYSSPVLPISSPHVERLTPIFS